MLHEVFLPLAVLVLFLEATFEYHIATHAPLLAFLLFTKTRKLNHFEIIFDFIVVKRN